MGELLLSESGPVIEKTSLETDVSFAAKKQRRHEFNLVELYEPTVRHYVCYVARRKS